MYRKGRAYRRIANRAAQKRKLLISRRFLIGEPSACYRGKLIKGKVHCSCPLCARKSYMCYSTSDLRKFEHLNSSYDEYYFMKGNYI